MTIIDGYTIIQEPQKNRIVISLPQTLQTTQSTIGEVTDRRIELRQEEEAALLVAVKAMFENGGMKNEERD